MLNDTVKRLLKNLRAKAEGVCFMTYNYYQGVLKERMSKFALALSVLGASLVLALGILSPALAASTTVRVSGDTAAGENQPGWLFNRDTSTSTPFEFTTDEASIGSGSLYVQPIGSNPADKFVGEYFYLDEVSTLDSFAYDFKIAGDGDAGDAEQFYLNVYTNLPGQDMDNYYDCRYDFVASTGSTSDFETFSIDKNTVPVHVQERGDADCPAAAEGLAGLPEGSTIRAISLNVGDTSTSASDEGIAGYLDNVVVSRSNGDVTTYDFEAKPLNKDECKRGGYEDFGYKNQGQCVADVMSSENSRHHREE